MILDGNDCRLPGAGRAWGGHWQALQVAWATSHYKTLFWILLGVVAATDDKTPIFCWCGQLTKISFLFFKKAIILSFFFDISFFLLPQLHVPFSEAAQVRAQFGGHGGCGRRFLGSEDHLGTVGSFCSTMLFCQMIGIALQIKPYSIRFIHHFSKTFLYQKIKSIPFLHQSLFINTQFLQPISPMRFLQIYSQWCSLSPKKPGGVATAEATAWPWIWRRVTCRPRPRTRACPGRCPRAMSLGLAEDGGRCFSWSGLKWFEVIDEFLVLREESVLENLFFLGSLNRCAEWIWVFWYVFSSRPKPFVWVVSSTTSRISKTTPYRHKVNR